MLIDHFGDLLIPHAVARPVNRRFVLGAKAEAADGTHVAQDGFTVAVAARRALNADAPPLDFAGQGPHCLEAHFADAVFIAGLAEDRGMVGQ